MQVNDKRARALSTPVTVGIVIAIVMVAVLIYYYFGTPPAGSSASASDLSITPVRVSILNGAAASGTSLGYGPDTITVVMGVNNTVTWTNNDVASHTVTSNAGDPASFDSGVMSPGQTFTFVFTAAGTYQYHCSIHSWMKGTVVVKQG